MEEVTEEYIDLNYFSDVNELLLYCITLTKPFREDVIKIRTKYKLNVDSIRNKLRVLGLSQGVSSMILRWNILVPRDINFAKKIMEYIDDKPITK